MDIGVAKELQHPHRDADPVGVHGNQHNRIAQAGQRVQVLRQLAQRNVDCAGNKAGGIVTKVAQIQQKAFDPATC